MDNLAPAISPPGGLGDAKPTNQAVLDSLNMSFWVGIWTTLVATVLGTSAALAIERNRFPGRSLLDAITHIPLIMPEIVLGLALLIRPLALLQVRIVKRDPLRLPIECALQV